MTDERIASVLTYWFAPERADDPVEPMRHWFQSDPEQDAEIGRRFGEIVEQASAGGLDDWSETPRGRLALVILLDQFRRNIFRGTPGAFECDGRALELCLEAIESGEDESLDPIERVFLYMPMQHIEDVDVQERSVREFARLRDTVAPTQRERFQGFLDYAILHRDIVRRFGRFPHRNAILGRDSTDDERDYLEGGGRTFGQG